MGHLSSLTVGSPFDGHKKGAVKMRYYDLSTTNLNKSRNTLIDVSSDKKISMYEVIFLPGQGIQPHIHPIGEDCAVVLDGELTYYITNVDTITAVPGEIVFGRSNVLHGYQNEGTDPIHLLVLVAPDKIGLDYPGDNSPSVRKIPIDERKKSVFDLSIPMTSECTKFESINIGHIYEEPCEEGKYKAFINWYQKRYMYLKMNAFLFKWIHQRL